MDITNINTNKEEVNEEVALMARKIGMKNVLIENTNANSKEKYLHLLPLCLQHTLAVYEGRYYGEEE